jgi:hypothetical protein
MTLADELLDLYDSHFKEKTMAPLPPPVTRKPFAAPKAPSSLPASTPVTKRFSAAAWTGEGEGEKIILYGGSGKGKSTLASMAPAPVILGLDDGGRKLRHPGTGEPLQHIPGLATFNDVRDALQQKGLFDPFKSVIIDTMTVLETWAGDWTCLNIPHEKGHKVKRLVDYGYGKGYEHLYDTMRLILADLDALVRQGKNVVLLCQQCPIVIANPSGMNFLENGPKLYAPGPDSKQTFTVRGLACEWADHVCRVDFLNRQVMGGGLGSHGREHAGKATGDTTRAIFTIPTDPSFFAKSRTLTDPVISFASTKDDSFWRLLFPDEYS